ncbi:MAG: RHS repeat-associated core domain-containing protein, partial [Acidobacteria bacterium]|nr:RHS repeat-associated core domain-containing protein [Acidobacteriota bacterium]
LRQLHYVPLSGGGNVIPQLDDYNYDALNRVTSVSESQQNSSGGWTFNLFTQNFGYDRWGNRTVSCSPCQPGVTGDVFTVDTATNRLTAKNGIGMTYDAAGNQTYDATGNRWFDGENRMYKATQGSVTSHYVYDADGKRVRRIVGSTETWMVYGLDGELVAEYAANGASGSPQKEYGYRGGQMLIVAQTSPLEIRWTVPDHLGTPRMNIRGTGTDGGSLASVTRHDYLPFGEELFAGVGLRSSSSHGYEPPADGVRQKLTGHERDGETGLDFAQSRYLSGQQGRFTSLDPIFFQGEMPNDPQRFNLFAYVRNNPLNLVDPQGEAIELLGTEKERKKILDIIKQTVGNKAGTYLYENKVTDKNGAVKYFVGVRDGGPDGKGKDFKDLNEVAGELKPIIDDTKIVGIQIVKPGTNVNGTVLAPNNATGGFDAYAVTDANGPDGRLISLPVPETGTASAKKGLDLVDASKMENGKPGRRDWSILLGHELGHARGRMTDPNNTQHSNESALRLENKVRELRYPGVAKRNVH